MRPIRLVAALVVVSALAFSASCSSSAPPSSAPSPQEDLHAGRLGHWLGSYLHIGGYRVTRGKAGPGTLLVDTVNGEHVDPPVQIWVDDVELDAGERVELSGYESGRFIGMPEEVARRTGLPLTQAMWQFQNYFIATSIESGGKRLR